MSNANPILCILLACAPSTQFQSRKDEIRNRNLEELTTLKNAMEETMDGLWSTLQEQTCKRGLMMGGMES